VAVTVTFGTTAPEESLTVPVKALVEDDWPNSDGPSAKDSKTIARHPIVNTHPTHEPVIRFFISSFSPPSGTHLNSNWLKPGLPVRRKILCGSVKVLRKSLKDTESDEITSKSAA